MCTLLTCSLSILWVQGKLLNRWGKARPSLCPESWQLSGFRSPTVRKSSADFLRCVSYEPSHEGEALFRRPDQISRQLSGNKWCRSVVLSWGWLRLGITTAGTVCALRTDWKEKWQSDIDLVCSVAQGFKSSVESSRMTDAFFSYKLRNHETNVLFWMHSGAF